MHFGFTLDSWNTALWDIHLLGTDLDLLVGHGQMQISPANILFVSKTSSRHVFKTSSRCVQHKNFSSFKTSWKCLEDVFKTSWEMSSRRLQDVFARRLQDISWRRLEDVLKTNKCLLGGVYYILNVTRRG